MFKSRKNLIIFFVITLAVVGVFGYFIYVSQSHSNNQSFEITGFETAHAALGGPSQGQSCAFTSDCPSNYYCSTAATASCNTDNDCSSCGQSYGTGFSYCDNSSRACIFQLSVVPPISRGCGVCVQNGQGGGGGGGTSGSNCVIPHSDTTYKFRVKKPAALDTSVSQTATSTNLVYFTAEGYADFNIYNTDGVSNVSFGVTNLSDSNISTLMSGHGCTHYRDYVVKSGSTNLAVFATCLDDDSNYIYFTGTNHEYQSSDTLDLVASQSHNFVIKNQYGQNVLAIGWDGSLYMAGCYHLDNAPMNFPQPSIITAQTLSQTSIRIMSSGWQFANQYPTYFKVYRSLTANDSNPALINANVAANGSSNLDYADTGLSSGTTYYYKVKGCNANGCSVFSNEISKTTCNFNCPTPPTVQIANSGRLNTLSWPAVSGATGYKIYVSTDDISYSLLATKIGSNTYYPDVAHYNSHTETFQNTMHSFGVFNVDNLTSFVDGHPPYHGENYGVNGQIRYESSNVVSGTTYYYKVVSVNAGGDSDYSNSVSAAPDFKYVFLSRRLPQTGNPAWTSTAQADSYCTSDKNAVGSFLPSGGTYKAILATSNPPRDFTSWGYLVSDLSASFVLPGGDFVGSGLWDLIDGNGISHAINQQFDGTMLSSVDAAVTTGMNTDGHLTNENFASPTRHIGTCGNSWEIHTNPTGGTIYQYHPGNFMLNTQNWINNGITGDCSEITVTAATQWRLYCMQQ